MLKIFKKTKKEKQNNNVKKEEKKELKATQVKLEKMGTTQSYRYLVAPLKTEKTSDLIGQNKYVLKVTDDANKSEIRKAVQGLYGVKVNDVNIINIPRKKRKFGRSEGYKPGYKKAIVTLAKGEKIEEL